MLEHKHAQQNKQAHIAWTERGSRRDRVDPPRHDKSTLDAGDDAEAIRLLRALRSLCARCSKMAAGHGRGMPCGRRLGRPEKRTCGPHQLLKTIAPPTRAPPATAPLRAPTDQWPVSGKVEMMERSYFWRVTAAHRFLFAKP